MKGEHQYQLQRNFQQCIKCQDTPEMKADQGAEKNSSPCRREWGSCKSPDSQKNWERKKKSPARFCLAEVHCSSSSTRNKHRAASEGLCPGLGCPGADLGQLTPDLPGAARPIPGRRC